MRNVTVLVTSFKIGSARITSYPYRPNKPRILYSVPLYQVTIKGKNENNNLVTEDFEAIRFGVYRSKNEGPKVVGLADYQTHTLSWDYITTMNDDAWRVYSGFFIHQGPSDPLSGRYGSIGCVEICGLGEWERFNDTIKKFSGLKSLTEVSKNKLVTVEYQTAERPLLTRV